MNLMKSTYICNLWYKRLMLGYLGTQITLQQTKLHAGNQHFPIRKPILTWWMLVDFHPPCHFGKQVLVDMSDLFLCGILRYGFFQAPVCFDCHYLKLGGKIYSQTILWVVKLSSRSHRHWQERVKFE
jgi:hypothetical protein